MRYIVLATVLAMASPALAQAPVIQVQNAWARATASPNQAGGVFLTVTDNGGADRLIAAATPVAGMAELHVTINNNGIMEMRPVDALPVTAGAPIKLTPDGAHIMLMNMKQKLTVGETFPVTLTFEKAGKITTTVTVAAAGASDAPMAGGMGDMPGMSMPGMNMSK